MKFKSNLCRLRLVIKASSEFRDPEVPNIVPQTTLWDMVDWDGLDISSEKAEMTGCPLAEALRWLGQRARAGTTRHGMSVSDKICALWTSRQSGHRTGQSGGAHLERIIQPVLAWKTDVKPMMMMMMMLLQFVSSRQADSRRIRGWPLGSGG